MPNKMPGVIVLRAFFLLGQKSHRVDQEESEKLI